jgi:ATP-dependent DNA helicase RecQ
MKDQVDKLNELSLKAELINSTISTYDKQIILNDVSKDDGSVKFLYIAPERLNSEDFIRVVSKVKIALVAIDEAHCISQW